MAREATQKTKKTVRIPLVGSAQNRESDPNKDQRFVNFIPESNKTPINNSTKIFLVKRGGMGTYTTPSAAAEGRGCYFYADSVYSVYGNIVYKDTSPIITLATSTGVVGWAEATGLTKYLFLCDGLYGYTITSSGVPTNITSLDFPTPHVPQPIFADGYIFLAKKDTADIYNSTLEDPLTWLASDFITAEMFPDNVVGLAKQNNLVIAVGKTSTEFFFDAGTATGSPLQRNAPLVQQFGSCAPYATFQNEKFCIIVGQSSSGGRAVWQIDGSTPKKISNEYIEKLLDAEGSTIAACTSFGVRLQGHFFYVLTLDTVDRTLVYDIEEKMWHEWSSNGDNKFAGKFVCDPELGHVYIQHATNGNLYTLKATNYNDAGTPITCLATTAKLDFDSMNRKTISDLYLVGDTATVDTYISYRWSDDDYQTWSNTHQINLAKRTIAHRSGMFRRRAYQFIYTDNYPCRLESLELDVRLGEH